jgi:hypothetical protein
MYGFWMQKYVRYHRKVDAVSQELMGQMSRIREQAIESEAVVRDITKDIQLLDLAKKNLTTSMTTLKRLQMLGAAFPILCLREIYLISI